MARQRLIQISVLVLAAILVVSAVLVVRETNYGKGPFNSAAAPVGTTREVAFVANGVGGTVSLIDVKKQAEIGRLNIIPDGPKVGFFRDVMQSFVQAYVEERSGLNYAQDTDISADGRVLFVSRGNIGDVAAFDIATGEILWRTPIAGYRSDHMDISPDGTLLFVAALIESGDIVEVLSTETGRKLGQFETGEWPHDVHVTADGSQVFVASLGDMTLPRAERGKSDNAYNVTVADVETLNVQRQYKFEAGVRPFQFTHDQSRLFAQLSHTHSVVEIDLATGNQIGRIDLPVAAGVSEEDWDFDAPHHGLALSRDEKTLCIAGRASDYAGIVNADDLSLRSTIAVDDAPSWSVFAADDRHCLLANNRGDTVSFVDIVDGAEAARIDVGRAPKHITIGQVPETVLKHVTDR